MASIAAKTPPSPSKKMARGEIDDLMDLHRKHLDELKTRLADLKLEARDVNPPYDDIFLLRYLLSNAKDPLANKGMDKAEAVSCIDASKVAAQSTSPRLTFFVCSLCSTSKTRLSDVQSNGERRTRQFLPTLPTARVYHLKKNGALIWAFFARSSVTKVLSTS